MPSEFWIRINNSSPIQAQKYDTVMKRYTKRIKDIALNFRKKNMTSGRSI